MRDLAAGWGFWLWWVLASTVAWAVGGSVGVALGRSGDIIVAGYVGRRRGVALSEGGRTSEYLRSRGLWAHVGSGAPNLVTSLGEV